MKDNKLHNITVMFDGYKHIIPHHDIYWYGDTYSMDYFGICNSTRRWYATKPDDFCYLYPSEIPFYG